MLLPYGVPVRESIGENKKIKKIKVFCCCNIAQESRQPYVNMGCKQVQLERYR